ncbi:MAG: adenine phosphoribosyltransferase, partial [Nitrospinae bacterium]|nr:adenine phosphoribosyltransferase [Nitrospinota bacterium]
MEELKKAIRDVPDFPKPGIVFKDITPLLADGKLYAKTVNALRDRYIGKKIDVVAGIEARGFIFGGGLAYALGAGLVIIRKPRKLPYKTFSQTYSLEYGTDTIEIHQDAVKPGQNVLVIDDVLATGGTVSAASELLKKNFRGNIVEVAFIIELDFLKGREKLQGLPIHS